MYVAESVTANNTKQAKGRFRAYENNDGKVIMAASVCSIYLII